MAEFIHPDDFVRGRAPARDAGGRGRAPARCQPLRVKVANGDWVPMSVDGVAGPEVARLRRRGRDPAPGRRPDRGRAAAAGSPRQRGSARAPGVGLREPAGRPASTTGVDTALEEMGGLAGVDRVEVVLFDPVSNDMINTHEWVGPGVEAAAPAARPHPHAGHPAAPGPAPPRGGQPPVGRRPRLGVGGRAGLVRRPRRAVGAGRARCPTRASSSGSSASSRWVASGPSTPATSTRCAARPASSARPSPGPRSRRQLAYQARHDPLTDLPNRWAFLEATGRAVAPARSRARARSRRRRAAVRPRPLQGDQRLARPQRGRRAADRRGARGWPMPARPAPMLARMGGDELVVLVDRPGQRGGGRRASPATCSR